MLVLGHVPTKAEIVLRKGYDFTWALTVEEDDPLPDDTTATLYVFERDGETLIGFWPAVEVLPGRVQFQVYADDHAIIPDSAWFSVALEKPGFPKTPWLEGRVAKANR